MVAVYVRAEGNASVSQFTEPVQLSIECEVLQNPLHGNRKTKTEQKPDQDSYMPRIRKGLHSKKEQDCEGRQVKPFNAREEWRHAPAGKQLNAYPRPKTTDRNEQPIPANRRDQTQTEKHSPQAQQQRHTNFETGFRPWLHCAMS